MTNLSVSNVSFCAMNTDVLAKKEKTSIATKVQNMDSKTKKTLKTIGACSLATAGLFGVGLCLTNWKLAYSPEFSKYRKEMKMFKDLIRQADEVLGVKA